MKTGSDVPMEWRTMQKKMIKGGWFRPAMPFKAAGIWDDLLAGDFPAPLTEVLESGDEIVLVVELPGVEKDKIKIDASKDRIDVGVEEEYEEETGGKGAETYRYAGRYSGFFGSYATPSAIDPDNVSASYKNGVLEIRAKKTGKEAGKKIEVR